MLTSLQDAVKTPCSLSACAQHHPSRAWTLAMPPRMGHHRAASPAPTELPLLLAMGTNSPPGKLFLEAAEFFLALLGALCIHLKIPSILI